MLRFLLLGTFSLLTFDTFYASSNITPHISLYKTTSSRRHSYRRFNFFFPSVRLCQLGHFFTQTHTLYPYSPYYALSLISFWRFSIVRVYSVVLSFWCCRSVYRLDIFCSAYHQFGVSRYLNLK